MPFSDKLFCVISPFHCCSHTSSALSLDTTKHLRKTLNSSASKIKKGGWWWNQIRRETDRWIAKVDMTSCAMWKRVLISFKAIQIHFWIMRPIQHNEQEIVMSCCSLRGPRELLESLNRFPRLFLAFQFQSKITWPNANIYTEKRE